jgi:alpha-ketoglutarate-dependent taurine dioxygenase
MTRTPHLRPLGAALGTEILGIDLSKPLDADTFAGIRAAFAEHPVLVFRDQDLGAPELAAFGRRLGTPRPTGRSILFVNPMHTHGFVGMKREEAWPLIDELAAHATQERFVYYHRWRVGDVLIWDERATMHRGAGDYRPDERRIMLRTIVYPDRGRSPQGARE